MKKIFSLVLTVFCVLGSSINASAMEYSSAKAQVLEYMTLVNQQQGAQVTPADREELSSSIEIATKKYQLMYRISKEDAYLKMLNEMQEEAPLNYGPSLCAEMSVVLPTAAKGDIFYIDNDAAWNHVGLYTTATTIVEAMPEDGVQFWKYNDTGAHQYVVTNPLDKENDSCILRVDTTDAKRKAAAEWPGKNVAAGTPYDYDFLDNKQDIYLREVYYYGVKMLQAYPESDAYNCSELVWKAYKKAASVNLDSNGGLAVYPNNIKNSSKVSVVQGNWW